jgi:hypothetical protein
MINRTSLLWRSGSALNGAVRKSLLLCVKQKVGYLSRAGAVYKGFTANELILIAQ